MSKKRKQYSSQFKAKVAIAAIKGDQTTADLAARFQIHPTQINGWKQELLEGAVDLFDQKNGKQAQQQRDTIDTLYRQIGQLSVERDFLARKLDQ